MYATAMASLSLEVYYRYLSLWNPIYGEEKTYQPREAQEGDKKDKTD